MKKLFLVLFLFLSTISIFAQEGYADYRNNFYSTPVIFRTGKGGSGTDSSIVLTNTSGSPLLKWYGTDGDNYSIGINTSDQAIFSNASGGYVFDDTVTAPQLKTALFMVDSNIVAGRDVFATTAETDTVIISGALATDIYIVSGNYTAGVDQQDVLEWEALAGKLVVHRLAAGESALKYSWFRIRAY